MIAAPAWIPPFRPLWRPPLIHETAGKEQVGATGKIKRKANGKYAENTEGVIWPCCCGEPCGFCPDGTPSTMVLTLDSVVLTAGCFVMNPGGIGQPATWTSATIDGTYCMVLDTDPCRWVVEIPVELQLYSDSCITPSTVVTSLTAFIQATGVGTYSGLFLNWNNFTFPSLSVPDTVGVFGYNGGSGTAFTSCLDPIALVNDDSAFAPATTGGTADITPGPC